MGLRFQEDIRSGFWFSLTFYLEVFTNMTVNHTILDLSHHCMFYSDVSGVKQVLLRTQSKTNSLEIDSGIFSLLWIDAIPDQMSRFNSYRLAQLLLDPLSVLAHWLLELKGCSCLRLLVTLVTLYLCSAGPAGVWDGSPVHSCPCCGSHNWKTGPTHQTAVTLCWSLNQGEGRFVTIKCLKMWVLTLLMEALWMALGYS